MQSENRPRDAPGRPHRAPSARPHGHLRQRGIAARSPPCRTSQKEAEVLLGNIPRGHHRELQVLFSILSTKPKGRRAGEAGADYRPLRRGWCLGTERFREELLEQMEEGMGAERYGEERRETMQARAERMVAEELQALGWGEEDLAHRPKGDPGKVAMAVRLRAQSTMTTKWIATRLEMGTPGYLHRLLHPQRRSA
ncbi:MAG: hypothetical protein H7A47_07990 [Verrucomicrobiales bacterium]|nr:hypothetical protein [Verrucomicrobiales bacterium]